MSIRPFSLKSLPWLPFLPTQELAPHAPPTVTVIGCLQRWPRSALLPLTLFHPKSPESGLSSKSHSLSQRRQRERGERREDRRERREGKERGGKGREGEGKRGEGTRDRRGSDSCLARPSFLLSTISGTYPREGKQYSTHQTSRNRN